MRTANDDASALSARAAREHPLALAAVPETLCTGRISASVGCCSVVTGSASSLTPDPAAPVAPVAHRRREPLLAEGVGGAVVERGDGSLVARGLPLKSPGQQ
jgi:hypothetical protein